MIRKWLVALCLLNVCPTLLRAVEPVRPDIRFNKISAQDAGGIFGEEGRIIGELADLMAQKFNYKGPVRVSHDIHRPKYVVRAYHPENKDKRKEGLIVCIKDGSVDVVRFLKLIDYGMTQDKIEELLAATNSALLTEVLFHKAYRPKAEVDSMQESYFFRYGKYHAFGPSEGVLAVFDNLHRFSPIDQVGSLVFDTDSTVCFVDPQAYFMDIHVSQKHTIPKLRGQNSFFLTGCMGGDRLLTSYRDPINRYFEFPPKEGCLLRVSTHDHPHRYIIYNYFTDELFPAMDTFAVRGCAIQKTIKST